MANRYFQKNSPTKGDGANGSTESLKGSKAGQKDPSFTAAPDNVKKPGLGFGNKATEKQRKGEARTE